MSKHYMFFDLTRIPEGMWTNVPGDHTFQDDEDLLGYRAAAALEDENVLGWGALWQARYEAHMAKNEEIVV